MLFVAKITYECLIEQPDSFFTPEQLEMTGSKDNVARANCYIECTSRCFEEYQVHIGQQIEEYWEKNKGVCNCCFQEVEILREATKEDQERYIVTLDKGEK